MMTLKKAELTQADVMAARFVGRGHAYWSELIHNTTHDRDSASGSAYRKLLEVLMCRERELTELMAKYDAVCERAAGIDAAV